MRKPAFCLCKTKAQISFEVTAQLISDFNFASYLRGRRSQKLLLVGKFTCINKIDNFVKETDTFGYIVV